MARVCKLKHKTLPSSFCGFVSKHNQNFSSANVQGAGDRFIVVVAIRQTELFVSVRWDPFDCSAAALRSHIFTCLPNKQCKFDPLSQETVSVVTHNHCPAPQQWSWNCCYVSLERVSMLSLIFAFQNPVVTPLSIHSLVPGVTCHVQLIRLKRWPVCFKGVCSLSLPHTRLPARLCCLSTVGDALNKQTKIMSPVLFVIVYYTWILLWLFQSRLW